MSNKMYLPLIVVILISAFVVLNFTNAISTSNLKNTTVVTKYGVTYADIINGADAGTFTRSDGDFTSCKKLTLYTMQPEDQIMSFVSRITTPFKLTAPNQNDKILLIAIRPERNGVEIQTSTLGNIPDIGAPTNLTPDTVPWLENGIGDSGHYGFFGDSETTDVVLTVCNFGPPGTFPGTASLDDLYQGEVDFYVNKIETP